HVAVFLFFGDREAALIDLLRAGHEPVVLRRAEFLQRRAAQVGPVMAVGATHRDEGAQAGLLLLRERAVVAGQEAIEGRRRGEGRLVGGERAAVVLRRHGLRVLRKRRPERRRVLELVHFRDPGFLRGKAHRAVERAFGLIGGALSVPEPAQRGLGGGIEYGRRVARRQR